MTEINIWTFKDNIREISRPNRFTAKFEGAVDLISYDYDDSFVYLISKASIPKKDISGPIFHYKGTQTTLSGDYKPEAIVVTFWNDAEWRGRTFIENWMDGIKNIKDESAGFRTASVSEYRNSGVNLIITQYGGSKDEILAKYSMSNVVPYSISNIELSHIEVDTFEEFTVDFNFTSFKRIQ